LLLSPVLFLIISICFLAHLANGGAHATRVEYVCRL